MKYWEHQQILSRLAALEASNEELRSRLADAVIVVGHLSNKVYGRAPATDIEAASLHKSEAK